MGRAEGAVTQGFCQRCPRCFHLYLIYAFILNTSLPCTSDTEQLVSLKDFTVFNALMTRPDPHFEIGAKYFQLLAGGATC